MVTDKLSRRQMLRGGAAAVGLTAAAGLQQKLAAHGVGQLGLNSGLMSSPQPAGNNGPEKFFDFKSWWKKHGLNLATARARNVAYFDPDILDMRSPSLAFKFQLQRSRNLIRIQEELRRDFARRISELGCFQWWG